MARDLLFEGDFGQKTYFHDLDDDKFVIETIEDCEPIIELNKIMAAELERTTDSALGWYVGTIPLTICERWARECNSKMYSKEWREYAIKQIQLPEYRAFNQNNIKL